MLSKLLTFFLTLSLLITTSTFAATPRTPKKPKLVLIPLIVSSEDIKLQNAMENALVEGLQDKYQVFSGDAVKKKGNEIFEKETRVSKVKCDDTKCMEDIALAFDSALIGTASVTKQEGGYFLSISIQDIYDHKVIYTKSLAYENQTAFQVIAQLKELAGTKKAEVVEAPVVEDKQIQPTKADADNELWAEVQKGNAAEDYEAYLDTYPKGKYASLAKSRIKKFKIEKTQKIEPIVQKIEVKPIVKQNSPECVFPNSNAQAPLWLCDAPVDGVVVSAVGSADKSPAGLNFQKVEATVDARNALVLQMKVYASNRLKQYAATTGAGDPAIIDKISESVQKQITEETLKSAKSLDAKVSPNGQIYVLIGLNQDETDNIVKNTIKASMKNNPSLWQEFRAGKSEDAMATQISEVQE